MNKAFKDKTKMVTAMFGNEKAITNYEDQIEYEGAGFILCEEEIKQRTIIKRRINEELNDIIRNADHDELYVIANLYEKWFESLKITAGINPRLVDNVMARILLIRVCKEKLSK